MSIASVAQDLYTIQSKKNVSLKTAASILLREELAARFSVYNIVKIVTKSSLLATIAQAKYGKPTPEQKKQQEEEKKDKDRSVLFQRYTLSSIANLNRRVGLLANIVDRNNQLISNLYNEIGHYRGARRISPQMLSSPKSIYDSGLGMNELETYCWVPGTYELLTVLYSNQSKCCKSYVMY